VASKCPRFLENKVGRCAMAEPLDAPIPRQILQRTRTGVRRELDGWGQMIGNAVVYTVVYDYCRRRKALGKDAAVLTGLSDVFVPCLLGVRRVFEGFIPQAGDWLAV
jgi:hypothetical protein